MGVGIGAVVVAVAASTVCRVPGGLGGDGGGSVCVVVCESRRLLGDGERLGKRGGLADL